MKHSMYCFGTDLLDEGVEQVLDNIQGRFGMDGITLAARYHAVSDIYPHNPRRKVAAVAPASYYRGSAHRRPAGPAPSLAPVPSRPAGDRDVLGELCDAAAGRGIEVSAWAVMLHDDTAGSDHPWAQLNCWGERAAGLLCPANPEVARYALSIVEDLASYPIDAVRAESLRFHHASHGGHHERVLEHYGPLTLWLLGLCFCEHCLRVASGSGIDGTSVRERVRDRVEASFLHDSAEPPLSLAAIGSELGDDVAAYVRGRARVITSLVRQAVAVAASAGTAVSFIDDLPAGASPGVGTAFPLAAERGFEVGIDAGGIARTGATLEVTAYHADPDRFDREASAYHAAIGPGGHLAAVLRAGHPDNKTVEELVAKAQMAAAAGCREINFYGYGLYRLETLDRARAVAEALR
ncbi:MAG: hypothetical protein ACYDH5_05460 [Acidimicrobiales bacterium]